MSAIPITPANSTQPITMTRIDSPTVLTGLRVLWVVLLVIEIALLCYLVPLSLTPENSNYLEPLESLGVSQTYFIAITVINLLSSIACGLLSAMMMWRSRNERTAIIFSFVFMIFVAAFGYAHRDALPFWLASLRTYLGILAIFTLLYLFPDGRFFPRWAGIVFVGAMLLLIPNFMHSSVLTESVSLVYTSGLLGGVASLVYRYFRAKSPQSQQIKWLLIGAFSFVATIPVALVAIALPPRLSALVFAVGDLIAIVLFLAVPLSITFAIRRYRLWEIDLIINRSLVYGLVTLLLLIIFGGIIVGVSLVTQGQGTVIGVAVAALASGAMFNPTRKAAQRLVDRRFYGLRFDLNELNAAQKSPEIKNPGALSGRKLGAYDVLDVIGKGGMGEVYKGHGNGQIVALKILPDDLAKQDMFRKRFEREVQTLQSLSHSNIVKLYDSGVSDGITYLAMEYIEGVELGDKLKQDKILSLDNTNDILRGLISALDYAHGQGLVHRDIKPSNVMLRRSKDSETWEAVLMDFGIAKIQDARTGITGTGAIGTIDYMAPEQIVAAKEVDKRADIYALGMMLYEMLTGEKPFKGSPAQVMFAHIQQPAPDPRDIQPEMPREIAKAIMKALEKKPEDRFDSAGEFAAALVS